MTAPVSPSGDFIKDEPIVAAHIAAWIVLNAGVLLVSRYHVFTSEQWSIGAIELTSIVTAGMLALMGWLQRRVVSPAWKVAAPAVASTVLATAIVTPPPVLQPKDPNPYMGGGRANAAIDPSAMQDTPTPAA